MSHSGGGTFTTTESTTPRPSTPESDPITPIPRVNPFATPYGSAPTSQAASRTGSTTALAQQNGASQRYFHSRRVKKGTIERPWLDKKDPREKWVTIIPVVGILLGLGVAGVLIWDGLQSVSNHKYCTIYEDNFSSGFNEDIWTKEVEVGGFGNGQFEQTTKNDENVFVQDGMLHIKPTLQDASLIENDYILDLGSDCTSDVFMNCYTGTNTTNSTIVNPVKSGRITTRKGANIKFGRIEVEAKLPAGDWLWPAIWMMPKDSVYGDWPRSGEIDIMESRGNDYKYAQGGNNIISSTMHWGPDAANDGYWRNIVKRKALHSTYADGFHTFGLEWSEKYIFTYIDTRLLQVMYTHFDKPFFERGNFPPADSNGTRITDPWGFTGRLSTPFDQDFYLILNVAVGGTNGWFEDGKSEKPWVNSSPTAKKDFWDARDQWYPTWDKRGEMVVRSVKMMQQSGYNGCSA